MKIVLFVSVLFFLIVSSLATASPSSNFFNARQTVFVCGNDYDLNGPGVWPLWFGDKHPFYFIQGIYVGIFENYIVLLKSKSTVDGQFYIKIVSKKDCIPIYEGDADWSAGEIKILQ